MSKKSTVMTEGAIWKEILFFSIPLILGNLFQQLYNTVDSIIVGNWIGSEALQQSDPVARSSIFCLDSVSVHPQVPESLFLSFLEPGIVKE